MLTRIPMTSTDIKSVGYDPKQQVLEIEFHKSGVYQYFSVPQATYDGLIAAPSAGQYLAKHIKGQYSFFRVSPATPPTP